MIRECLVHFADELLPARAPARLSVLEPRILYSASPIDAGVDDPVVTDMAHDAQFVDQFEPYPDVFLTALDSQLPVSLLEPIAAFPTEQHEPLVRELVLVNDNIENLSQLVNDLLDSFKGRQFELVTISQSSDGIAQVNEILKQYSSLDSIHVFSHGSTGQINLGNAWLDAADFSARLDDLSAWGNALTADGDLLFYGCDLAGDESGRNLLRILADATGADVAASDDLTGNSLLGGNWDLEFVVGDVPNTSWLSVPQDWHWSGLLDSATFQNGLSGYAGTQDSGLDASNPATSLGNSSRIEVVASPDMDGLIRFDNLFGSGPGQIQFGSGINSVTLTIEVVDTSLSAANIGLHRMLVAWDETSTWNSLAAGVSTDNVEASAVADGLISSPSTMGPQTFSGAGLVATVQAWSNGQTNFGWLMVNDKNNNLQLLSSESGTISLRPKLLIDYTLPNAGPTNSLPGSQTTAQNTSLTLSAGNSNQISTNDPDAGSSNVEITLAVANGTVSLDLPNAVANAVLANESLSGSTITGLQKETQIARLEDGRYVVVWSGNGPGDSDGIFLRQFEADGTPIGNQTRFNGNGAKALPQSSPTVSVNEAGRIVVAWESLGQDSAGTYGIYARSMNWDGTNDTGEITVNFNTLWNQEDPSVGIDAAGNFIVAWTDNGALDGQNEGVFARRFNASGVALDANDRQINSYWFNKQLKPEVAMMADGSHVIVWQSQNQEAGGSQYGIYGKRFDASGNPLDAPGTPGQSEFQINVTETKDQSEPSISIDNLGRFVVVWQSKEQAGSTNGYDIYGQMFDGSGNKIGPTEFHVNTTAAFEQFNATVAMDANGDFVVAWENYTGLSGPTDINFQQFDSLANKVGGDRIANSSATGNQFLPDVGIDAAGNFIVVWDGFGTADTDGGVFSRSYNLPSNGLTFSSGDGIYDSNMVFRGSLANVNAALDGLIFRPTAGFTGLATITITTNDLGNTGYGGSLLDTDILNIDVTTTGLPVGPISDTNASSNQVAENAANGTSVGITASATDPDVGQTVSYTLDDNAGGRFAIDSLTGIVTVANGSLLDYEAASNHNITVRATSIDGSFSTLLFSIALMPVNDNAPVITSPNNCAVNENQTILQILTATDADAPAQTLTFSITGGVDGAYFLINGSNQLVFSVAPDYETPLDFDLDNIYEVEIAVSDGAGGTAVQTIFATVLDGPEVATAKLWFTTKGTANASGLTWSGSELIEFGDSGDTFDTDAGITAGTFSKPTGFAAAAPMRAMHYVESFITIGTTGATFSLRPGDLILTLDPGGAPATVALNTGDANLANDFLADRQDIVVFRPTLAGNYGAGEYFMLFDNGVHDATKDYNVHAISLVENATWVGGKLLDRGTFLVAHSDKLLHNNIYTFTGIGTGFGVNTQTTNCIDFLKGLPLGLGPSPTDPFQIQGLHLIQQKTQLGSTIFNEGTLLVAVNGSDTYAGQTLEAFDIVALTVTKTEQDASPGSVATARMLFDGSDIGLQDAVNEPINGLTIISSSFPGGTAPIGSISDANLSANNVAENALNGTTLGITALAVDPNPGDTVSYSLDNNAGGRFAINGLSGVVTVANGLLLDYETAVSHNISVRATSSDGSSTTRSFTVSLLPVNDNSPVFSSSNNPTINENQFFIQTLAANDADAPLQSISFAITGGVDSGFFTINGSNQLAFLAAPDYETPLDFDLNNFYLVEVAASDGAGGLTPMMITVQVLNIAEASVLYVDTTSDVADGNTTSIGALLSSRGLDGKISLREALTATNNTPNAGGPDMIRFAIPDNDPGHYYYRNNGIAGTFSAAVTTTLNDALITDFDPDYPYSQHSWFRINLNNALLQLAVNDPVVIDGYSQPGANVNTLATGQNASIRIELTNTANDSNRGLTFDTGANGSVLKGLAINRFGGMGVLVEYGVHNVTIQGNFIGTDITGTVDLGNGDSAIQLRSNNNLVGGPALADRNVLSGNDSRGVALFNTSLLTGNVIRNNHIGTDSTGLKAIANDTAGVQLYNSNGTQVVDNVISGNGDGIWFRSGGGVLNINNVVTGNRIGLGANGTAIVANTGNGILVDSGSLNTIGGTTAATANYISGNLGNGISLTGSSTFSNVITGNHIGLNTALAAAGNVQAGVSVDLSSYNNRIGGTVAGAGNRIANNGGDGVRIKTAAGIGNAILGNSIFSNGELGIDLGANGVLANDPGDLDIGPNSLQNYPVIGSAVTNGTSLTVSGSFNSMPLSSYRLEFFASPVGDPSGNGEGEIFVGFVDVTTGATGMAAFNSIFAVVVPAGYSISATATDSLQSTSEFSASVIATIPVSNLPPTDIGPNSFAIVENTNTTGGFSLGVLTVTDPDVSDTFTFQIMPGSDGSKFSIGGAGLNELIITDGMIDYERQSVYSVNVRVTDSFGNSYDETLKVAVTNVDENPVANAGGPYTINEGSGVTLNGLGSTDPEGGPLTYRWDLNNDGIYGDVTGASPAVSWATLVSRGITNQGTFTIGLETTDAGGNRNTATTTLTVNNLAPTANPNAGAGFVTNEDTAFVTGNVLANDSDPNSNDTLSVTGMNTSLTLGLVTNNGNGTFTYNPNGQFENLKPGDTAFDSFVYFMQDEFGAVSSATVTVTINGVNDEQQLVTNNLLVVLKGAAASLNSLSLRTTDLDHSASSLVYTITSNPANGRVELVSAPGVAVTSFTQAQLDAAQLLYVHNNSNTASDSFGFSVDDGLGAVSAGTFNISVILIDQPPVANSGGPYSINEGSSVGLNGLGSADPEGGALTYRWDLNNDGIFGDVTGASPTVNWATLVSRGISNQGTFAIGLEVTDPASQSHVSTTTLTVNNLAPTANSDSGAGFVTNEDSVFVTDNVLTNDSDPNSNDTLSLAGINTSLTKGLVTNNGNGTFTYNPNGQFESLKPGDTAFDTFVYTLRDEFGATSFATVTVTINGFNDTPVALNDSYTAILGSPLVIAGPGLLANDSDVDSTFLTMLIVSGPLSGTLTSMPNGSFTYTPVGNFVGNDSFTYMVNDGLGNSNLATVSILVAGVGPTGGSGGGGGSSGGNKDDDKDSPDTIIPGPLPEYLGLSDSTPNKADQMPGAGEKPAVQNAIRMEVTRPRSELEWTDESGEDSYWYRYLAGMKKSAELQTGDFGMLRNLEFMSQNGAFWQSLDGFLNNAVTNASLPIFVTGGSVAFTTSITAGYLVWLIRGGQILTALMANIPAWRLIDPLPILGRLPVEDDEDDDSLATMLAESSEDDYTKTFDWSDLAETEEATSPSN